MRYLVAEFTASGKNHYNDYYENTLVGEFCHILRFMIGLPQVNPNDTILVLPNSKDYIFYNHHYFISKPDNENALFISIDERDIAIAKFKIMVIKK